MMPHFGPAETPNSLVGDEEDIISSFENDTFLKKYNKINNQNTSVKLQLDNLLLWLNSDLVPDFLAELPIFTNKEVKDCLNKIKIIQRVFSTLHKNMEKQKSRNDFTYTCSKCSAAIDSANHSVSVALQQHEHIEEALANSYLAKNGLSNTLLEPVAPNYCGNCSVQLNIPTNFKFSFNISYHPDVEMFLYMRNFTNDIVTIDNFNLFTIQLRDAMCLCLLCIRDFSVSVVKEHLEGRKHAKSKTGVSSVVPFLSYHKNWLMQESCYQAHQVYFNPLSADATICWLCNNLQVPYRLLNEHIKGENHKLQILGIQNKNVLVQLQKEVYFSKQGNSQESPVRFEPLVNLDEPSTSSRNRNMHLESENSENESYLGESDDVSTGLQEEENNKPKVEKTHEVIKSIQTDSEVELYNFLEHRFWPHFDKIMSIYGQKVVCSFCNIQMNKNHNLVTQHIFSSNHKKCSEIPKKFYKFYCEICNIWLSHDHMWFGHLKNDKHKTRCQGLGESRQRKLTEYECISCKQIFFGDDISAKRHILMSNKGNKRKPNKIALDKKVNEIFMREENIINEAHKLVKDAEDVLLNSVNIIECCGAIEEALMETYPTCSVYPFGSQVSGLGSKKSDLDLFVDLGDMYFGDKGQDSTSQVKIVSSVMKIFAKRKGEFQYLNAIPRARTPIVQLYHVKTRLDCDLSFRHGLSVENTKFLRLCIKAQPCTQYLVLLLKQWLEYTKLAHRHVTTYSLAMMVIFYLQENKYLIPVHKLSQLSSAPQITIDGWSIMDLSTISVEDLKKYILVCNKSIKEMLTNFFLYYKNFNYTTDIICPLLGQPLKKSLFIANPQGFDLPLEMAVYVQKVALNTTDLFKAQSPMCIQDPFDLSHNLTKGCSNSVVEQLKKLCDLSYKLLATK